MHANTSWHPSSLPVHADTHELGDPPAVLAPLDDTCDPDQLVDEVDRLLAHIDRQTERMLECLRKVDLPGLVRTA